MRRRVLTLAAAVVAGALALAGCAASAPTPTASTPAVNPTPTPTPTPTPDPIDALSLEQQVGQLFMVGTTADGADAAAMAAVTDRHVGNIFLRGRSQATPAAVAAVVQQFTSLVGPATMAGTRMWVATDQEGGEVQVLQGPGFSQIPYGIRQADLPDDQLRAAAGTWGSELAAAGVDMNLAPVADIVTSADVRFDNPPIGAFGRQYGYDAATVGAKAGAFAAGMRDAGVMPTFKHFPGLGHVTANTDTTANVVDTTVVRGGPDITVYTGLTSAGPSVVMVSSATYQNLDPAAPAMFSPVVVGDILRGDVGFDGVVMTDDISGAVAVRAVPPADRAVRAIDAGVDLLLLSADASPLPAMYDAVLARAQQDAGFAQKVEAAAARILAAKSAHP
ncbi:glycoside hydrolase family 3 protein [Microbacterium sp. W1N]|uniref:glycoside hydrolase family 3 N-terminal domain-containing protein n=1 Tax=Microbacterium festucae TaxID=2977531 RepID=UPI0021BED12B|nr:glycoside hydrolase family 3 N-terminal domain-containing protein [Microbacterium festucae]MCT9819262.1 glycoside hydrolase family 3 protein [Microbacterium festucae]